MVHVDVRHHYKKKVKQTDEYYNVSKAFLAIINNKNDSF